jgi:hypothetical protein
VPYFYKGGIMLNKIKNNEDGDIVQTLIIIGIAVVLGGLLLVGLRPVVENCLTALDTGRGTCFGVINNA